MEQLRKFAKYFKPYKWHIISGIFFILMSMLFGLLVPYLVGAAVDDLAAGVTREKIIYYPLAILVVNLLSGVFLFLQRRLLINTSRMSGVQVDPETRTARVEAGAKWRDVIAKAGLSGAN